MRPILALILLFSISAQAKPWDAAKVSARLEAQLGESLKYRSLSLVPGSLKISPSYGFRESLNHMVMDWTFGQIGALVQEGRLWDDVTEQLSVRFFAEGNGQRFAGAASIAVMRYANGAWLIQYYSSPHSLVATEAFSPKYELAHASAEDLFREVATCSLKNGKDSFKVMVNGQYENAFGNEGVPVALVSAKDVSKDALFDIRGRADVVVLKGVRRYDLLMISGEVTLPSVFGPAAKKTSVEMTVTTDNSFTEKDSALNALTMTTDGKSETFELSCRDARD